MKPRTDGRDEIVTVRIELRDSDPLIWREVEVPTSVTLKVLNDIVQIVMGWTNSHLWEFTIGRKKYGLPTDEDWRDEPLIPASKARLRELLNPRKTRIDYLYDFGDSWEHLLTVSDIRRGSPGILYPRYLGGERNGPPEDCGGIPGFYAALEARADPSHPDHEEIAEWLGGYDPDLIDEASIRKALGGIAKRISGGRRASPPE